MSLIDAVLAVSPAIRYVALYQGGRLDSRQRPGIVAPSTGESDKYEELIVNPTLLTLLGQRGDIDCGGLRFVLIRYGNFVEYVQPLRDGHLSVGIEPQADAVAVVTAIQSAPSLAEVLAGVRPDQRLESRRRRD